MHTRVLRRLLVFLRARCRICICCSILILLIKTVRCRIVRCSIHDCILVTYRKKNTPATEIQFSSPHDRVIHQQPCTMNCRLYGQDELKALCYLYEKGWDGIWMYLYFTAQPWGLLGRDSQKTAVKMTTNLIIICAVPARFAIPHVYRIGLPHTK